MKRIIVFLLLFSRFFVSLQKIYQITIIKQDDSKRDFFMGCGPDSGCSGCSDIGTGLCRQEDAAANADHIWCDGGADGCRRCRRVVGSTLGDGHADVVCRHAVRRNFALCWTGHHLTTDSSLLRCQCFGGRDSADDDSKRDKAINSQLNSRHLSIFY